MTNANREEAAGAVVDLAEQRKRVIYAELADILHTSGC